MPSVLQLNSLSVGSRGACTAARSRGKRVSMSAKGFERASWFWGFQIRLKRKTWLGNAVAGLSTPKLMMLPATTL